MESIGSCSIENYFLPSCFEITLEGFLWITTKKLNLPYNINLLYISIAQYVFYYTSHVLQSELENEKANVIFLFCMDCFFKLRFTSCKAEQPLPGMELQEKEAQQRLKHRGPTVKRCLLILDLKSLRSQVKGKHSIGR